MSILDRALRVGEAKQFKHYEKRVARINDFEPELELLDDAELREHADALRERARGRRVARRPAATRPSRSCARRGSARSGMRHFDVQLIGGMVLHDGSIAEMRTGEGKTLTATLPSSSTRSAGEGVHLVTVNDYLARRDAEWMSPIYDAARAVRRRSCRTCSPTRRSAPPTPPTSPTAPTPSSASTTCATTWPSSLEEKVQHGGRDSRGRASRCSLLHTFAIVDEVDNILIDEARTPLIISGAPEQAADLYASSPPRPAADAGQEARGHGPEDRRRTSSPTTTSSSTRSTRPSRSPSSGVAKAERFLGIDHLYRAENGHLVNHLIQALKAESLYKRDVDYAVVDGEVKIIDEFTGRILEGRRWSEGLHQAVEAKEGVRVQEENQTLATITLQNYFRMYEKLAGMTGTALTEATEFMKIYKLDVVEIPTNQPMVREDRNDQVYKTKDGKWTRGRRRDRGAPREGPAGARRHDLRRGLRAARRASSTSAASSTRCSTPSPSTPSARARRSPRRAAPARSRSPRTWPAAASTSSSAATPST